MESEYRHHDHPVSCKMSENRVKFISSAGKRFMAMGSLGLLRGKEVMLWDKGGGEKLTLLQAQ